MGCGQRRSSRHSRYRVRKVTAHLIAWSGYPRHSWFHCAPSRLRSSYAPGSQFPLVYGPFVQRTATSRPTSRWYWCPTGAKSDWGGTRRRASHPRFTPHARWAKFNTDFFGLSRGPHCESGYLHQAMYHREYTQERGDISIRRPVLRQAHSSTVSGSPCEIPSNRPEVAQRETAPLIRPVSHLRGVQ